MSEGDAPDDPPEEPPASPVPTSPSLQTPDVPTSAVALDGGDVWIGERATDDELSQMVALATSRSVGIPIISQYYPGRSWLWRQWRGTIVRRVLPQDVLSSLVFATCVSLFFQAPGPHAVWRAGLVDSMYLGSLAKVWTLSATMVTFTLSFFLSQSYSLWRSVYSLTRRVQGRLNDLGLLCATYAARNVTTGEYTDEADITLSTTSRYVRLFAMLFYASATTRFAPLKTPNGLSALVTAGALTPEERECLLESSMGHDAVVGWMGMLFDASVADGRLGVSVARRSSTSPIAVQMSLQNKLIELRATYAAIPDELTGRMPLAYVQLVQILTDFLILATPLALTHAVGGFGAVLGTGVVTLFHSSIVNLAKLFLDPFNNEAEQRGGDQGIGGISVATLLQETNVGSERWRRSASRVPSAAWKSIKWAPLDEPNRGTPSEPPSLVQRIFGGSQYTDAMTDGDRVDVATDMGDEAAAVATVSDVGDMGGMGGAEVDASAGVAM